MSGQAAAPEADPHHLGHDGHSERSPLAGAGHAEHDSASRRIIAGYGFWIFLLSDIVMFSAFFAAFAVLKDETDGGPTGQDLFNLGNAALETGCLLLSSYTCGVAGLGIGRGQKWLFYGGMAATFVLGAAFLGLEVAEFRDLIAQGAGPGRSAFLSSFFALVGLHGLHVGCGLLWLLTMMAQVFAKGARDDIMRRMLCFSLFWHALDIVWVAIFSTVYLIGANA